MNDLEYTIRKICERRGVTLSKVESVAFLNRIQFGLATGTELLPATASTFFYITNINLSYISLAGTPQLEFKPNAGAGSAGAVIYTPSGSNGYVNIAAVECDSLTFNEGSFSAGQMNLFGTVFKVTYGA